MMKAGRCPLLREERSFPVASPSPSTPPLGSLPTSQPCHRCSPPLDGFPSPRQRTSVICNQRVCFRFHPTAGSWFRAPPPTPFHVSAPVSSFASRSVCGFSERGQGRGTSAAGMADPAPVLTAPWLAAGGELAGVRRAELPALGGLWPALLLQGFALIWGDGSDRAAAPVLGRPRLGVLRAKCRRAEATPVLAGTGQQPKERCQGSPIPRERRGCPRASTLNRGCHLPQA